VKCAEKSIRKAVQKINFIFALNNVKNITINKMAHFKFKLPKLRQFNYCPHCRRRTEHVIDEFHLLCKRCGRKYKKTVATSSSEPQQKLSRSVGRYFKKIL
jgi:tRNA(Ile2) C34 agmatinyltransferase TiaS